MLISLPFTLQSRELEVSVYWHDWRQLCGVTFVRLDGFLDNASHNLAVPLEPRGRLFVEVRAALLLQVAQ